MPYIRQSRAKERTISIDEQRRSIQRWAASNDVTLGEEIVESGVSGSKPWRERALGRAVAACESGAAAGVIVAFQDRLSRENGLATAEVWEALDRAGARLVAAAEGLDTAAGDQELLFTIKAAIAREQWKRFRQNWSDARRNAVERGVHFAAHVPFGYERGDDGRLVIDEEKAKLVRSVFKQRAQGASLAELCRFLEAAGAKPRRGRRVNGEARWTYRAIQSMVATRTYLGEARSGEFVNPDAHEPIVTRAAWLAAQTKQPGRLTKGGDGARLAGLVYCACCGGRMTPGIAANRYRCLKRTAIDRCEAPGTARMRALDELVIGRFLERYETGADLVDEPSSAESEKLRRKLEVAIDARDTLLDDINSLAALPADLRRGTIERAQAAVDDAQAALDSCEVSRSNTVIDMVRGMDLFEDAGDPSRTGTFRGHTSEGWVEHTALPVPAQRRLLTRGIEKIVVSGGSDPLEERVRIHWRDEASEDDLTQELSGDRTR